MEPAPDQAENEKEEFYQVEKIVQSKLVKGKKFYQVKWVGYSSKDNTWEPTEHLSNVIYMVEEYEEAQNKSGNKDKSE